MAKFGDRRDIPQFPSPAGWPTFHRTNIADAPPFRVFGGWEANVATLLASATSTDLRVCLRLAEQEMNMLGHDYILICGVRNRGGLAHPSSPPKWWLPHPSRFSKGGRRNTQLT